MCPLMRLVPGARGDTSGDRLCPDPVWKSTSTSPLPPPLPRSMSAIMTEATRAHRQKLHPRFHPHWPPSTCTPQGSTWGPKRMRWRCPPVTIRSRCAALARTPLTESAWPTGWPRAGSRPWPWNRPGSRGSRWLSSWSPGALRGCGSIRHRWQKIKGRPKSAVHACQGRPRRQTFGLLAGAFRPPEHGCVLRSYLRPRAM